MAPSLQNWWTVERSLVGSTPIRFRQKESQKAPQSLKSLAGLYFIQVPYSPMVSLGIWIYRVIFVGILRIWNGRCGIMPFHKPFCGEYRYSFQDFFRYRQRKEIPSRNNFPFVGARPSTLEPADILGAVRHRGVRGALRWTTGLFSFPGRCAGTLIRGIYEIWRSRGFE